MVLREFKRISAGGDHTCAVWMISDVVKCLGLNNDGQLGNNNGYVDTTSHLAAVI